MDLLRSLPIGLYLEKPVTWLHHLDPRVKLGWLTSFLLSPILANPEWRVLLVVMLIGLTFFANIPWRVWRQQMGLLLVFCGLVCLLTCVLGDGLNLSYQPRLPEPELQLPAPSNYEYVLFEGGRFKVTQRSLELGIRVGTLLFTLIYSSTLYLLVTAPEEITAGLEYLLQPLKRLGLPVTEIVLTLALSLRFIHLVLEEVQNLARSVTTRAIDWNQLGIRKSIQLFLLLVERLLKNLLLRAEQIAISMDVRGFTRPDRHQVQWHQFRWRFRDWLALTALFVLWSGRLVWGGQ